MALTQLYAATKLSCTSSFPQINPGDGSELLSLQRKYRIQRDRLVAWGLDWSDNTTSAVSPKISTRTTAPDYSPGLGFIFTGKASSVAPEPKANIDDSLERAGLAEIVMSVLENIKGIITEVEQIRRKTIQPLSPAGFPLEKPGLRSRTSNTWTASDRAHYEDLVKDLTSALDLLCDLSHVRRGTSPAPAPKASVVNTVHPRLISLAQPAENTVRYELDPSLTVPKMDASSIKFTEEPPPPYNHFGVPCPVRVIGRISRKSLSQSSAQYHPRRDYSVLIEYAPYDSIHRETGLALPLSRLDLLFSLSTSSQAQAYGGIPKLIGYFEDPKSPQLGLVYELPDRLRKTLSREQSDSKVTNLMNLLQSGASRIHNNRQSSMTEVMYVPPLEERFVAAYKLVRAFSFLHEQGLPHRSVNSYNISFLSTLDLSAATSAASESKFILREPIISSFDLFSEYSLDTSPEYLHQNIYRHPDDPNVTAPDASKEYLPAFELYSLGLILLEIGLWIPLSDMFKEKYSLKEFRTRIEKLYTRRLAGKCGTSYMRAVQDCLAAGNEKSMAPGSLQTFYARILSRLQKCSALDDEEQHSEESLATTILAEHALLSPDDTTQTVSTPATVESSTGSLLVAGDATQDSRYEFWDINVPQHVSKAWPAQGERLDLIMSKALRKSRETYSIGVSMTGTHRETARPTFVLGCTSVSHVKAWIDRFFEYDQDSYDLVIVEDSIVRSKATASPIDIPNRSNGDSVDEAKNPGHQQRPLCGASIGAWQDEIHLQPVSFGGVVLVDGEPYGMSVHHMMEDNETDDEGKATSRSTLPARQQDENPPYRLEDIVDEDTDDEGDTAGIIPEDGEEVRVTQPALDDIAEDFFPDEETKDEDHLDSHSLGHVYASSGLRCSIIDGITYEIDWALIKLNDDRLQPYNIIAGGRRYCRTRNRPSPPMLREPVCRNPYRPHEDLLPWQIVAKNEFENFTVHVFGRTTGLVSGSMFKDPVRVRFPGRRRSSSMWAITGTLGPAGNSGAWVIENTEGRVCGHVLGRSTTRTNRAYMSAMDLMFDDIKETLGARSITLPGAEGLTSSFTGRTRDGSHALPDITNWSIAGAPPRTSSAVTSSKKAVLGR